MEISCQTIRMITLKVTHAHVSSLQHDRPGKRPIELFRAALSEQRLSPIVRVYNRVRLRLIMMRRSKRAKR